MVIVTVAVTSVMHVQDNKTSQQEYLACASAAELIKDCVAGNTYTYTEKTGTYTYNKSQDWWGNTETGTETKKIDPTEEITPTNGDMENFVKTISRVVRDADWDSATGELYTEDSFTVKQSVNDIIYAVDVKCKLVKNSGIKNQFLLKFKLSCAGESSEGYVMSMVIPLTKSNPDAKDTKGNYYCELTDSEVGNLYYNGMFTSYDYRDVHREMKNGSMTSTKKEHEFTIKNKVTQVAWGKATDSSLKISKGAEDYDN